MTNPELSRKLRRLYPVSTDTVEVQAAETRRSLRQLLTPEDFPQSGDNLVTPQNQAELDEKLGMDEDEAALGLAANVFFVGERHIDHEKSIEKREVSKKKQFLKALRDFSGFKMVEAKSLAYPKGILNHSRLLTFIQSLQTYRSMMNDDGLTVSLDLVDAQGCIIAAEIDFGNAAKKHIRLDDDAKHLIALLNSCEEIEFKKRPVSTKMY